MADAMQVVVTRAPNGIPVAVPVIWPENSAGWMQRMYAIAAKVERPAITSVRKELLSSV